MDFTLNSDWIKYGFTPSGYQRYRNKKTKQI